MADENVPSKVLPETPLDPRYPRSSSKIRFAIARRRSVNANWRRRALPRFSMASSETFGREDQGSDAGGVHFAGRVLPPPPFSKILIIVREY